MIKKGLYILSGLWCVFATMITPIWLSLTYLNLSGEIYQYDYSMDEGTAVILGFMMLCVWLLLALLPCILFLRKMRMLGRKAFIVSIIVLLVLIFLGIAMQILRFSQIL